MFAIRRSNHHYILYTEIGQFWLDIVGHGFEKRAFIPVLGLNAT